MSDPRVVSDSDSVEDPIDDGQLTIRIPNPKVYMARQSQWKGRRGKPRCDHCRINNLKCDRVLPTCNHCSWASGRECRYTPLPTPAHRGIPRCDRCRTRNLKCDRNLPVCNHCAEDETAACNYTPKKRHKVPLEQGTSSDRQMAPYGNKGASFLISDMSTVIPDLTKSTADNDGHSFYGQNVASSSRFARSPSPTSFGRDGSSEIEMPRLPPSGSFTPDFQTRVWPARSQKLPLPAKLPANNLSFISHSFPGDQGVLVSRSLVDPWCHPSFPPLPDLILQRLSSVNSVEMPNRQSFEGALGGFLEALMPELRETATFSPDMYARIWRYLTRGDPCKLSERLRMWLSYHHVRSGSDKTCLLIMPRDPVYNADATNMEKVRREFVSYIDGKGRPQAMDPSNGTGKAKDLSSVYVTDPADFASFFERIPVQPQIYDILVFCHSAHASSRSMLIEIRKLGMACITWPMVETFVRLCPLCNLRKPVQVQPLSARSDGSGYSAFDSMGMK